MTNDFHETMITFSCTLTPNNDNNKNTSKMKTRIKQTYGQKEHFM